MPGPVAGVPFMVTRAMVEKLRKLGLTAEQIARLTPQEAHDIIAQAEQASAGQDAGLSQWRLQQLAPSYADRAHALMHEQGTTDIDLARLDAELRQKLSDLGVRPEHIEIEFERVMAEVFKRKAH